nr:GTP pyrophosphokinase family protein [Sanguibacter sp. HDW7]
MLTLRDEFTAFMLQYKFAIDEVLTKVSILRDEFTHLHHENPIEHVTSRLKSPESVLDKVERKDITPDFESIRASILDIAGVRIICSFVPDIYTVLEALRRQDDLTVLAVKDYIAEPKPNGYRSLHLIVSVPVFLSSGTVPVTVEIQIRTSAMDFWASLEHKIYYKYDRQVPGEILDRLRQSALVAAELDATMTDLRDQVNALDERYADGDTAIAPSLPGAVPANASFVPVPQLLERLVAMRSRRD